MTGPMTEAALFELLTLECCVDSDGTARYYNALGQIHRAHGPAVERPDGYRAWYQNGQRHRIDGPAVEYIEYNDARKIWYQNNRLHRLDGPAVEYSDGFRAWFINNERLTEAEWLQQVSSMGIV